jgi:flagellin
VSRINTNTHSLIAQRVLGGNTRSLNTSLERLSTGLRINRGSDDPAGLIASENLRGEMKSMNQAIANAERADQVMNIAEGGLQEVSSLLTELQGLITSTASSSGTSLEEKRANQLQIDSILQTIDRISSSTNFQGIKMLNGTFDFTIGGLDASKVSEFRVNSAKFSGANLNVDVAVTQSAQTAQAFLGGPTYVGSLTLSSNAAQFVVEIGGTTGSREYSFANGTTIEAMATAINQFSDVTGVIASAAPLVGGFRELSLRSRQVGKDEFVSVRVIDDGGTSGGARVTTIGNTNTTAQVVNADVATSSIRANGQDVRGTINGMLAEGQGNTLSIASDFLDAVVGLDMSAAQTLGKVAGTVVSGPTASISGGGATFQLGGKVDIGNKVSLGIAEVSVRTLGNRSGLGSLSTLASGQNHNAISGDLADAQRIVSASISEVAGVRGRIGAFQRNVVATSIRSLGVNIENTNAAQSLIRDADFAAETANLTRSQILVSAATNVLGLANSQPQSALQLLG